jgi:hypothetical protein
VKLARKGSLEDLSKRLDRARDDLARSEEQVAEAARERTEKLADVASQDIDADGYADARRQVLEREQLALDRRDGAVERVRALEAICGDLAEAEARTHVREAEALLAPLVDEETHLRERLEQLAVERAEIEERVADLVDASRHARAPFDPEAARRKELAAAQEMELIGWTARQPTSRWESALQGKPPRVWRAVEAAREQLNASAGQRQVEIARQAAASRAEANLIDDGDDPNAVLPGHAFPKLRV